MLHECLYFKNLFFSFHLCTHEPGTRSGHCQGDSGGPLFLLESDNREGGIKINEILNILRFFLSRYVQIGVASFGSIVDCGSKPGGFSRLTYDVMQWIRKVKVKSSVKSQDKL